MKSILLLTAALIVPGLVCSNRTRATPSPRITETRNTGCLDRNVRKPQTISLGRIDSRVIEIPKPAYPTEAKDAKISGVVTALVVVDETGKVIWARVRNSPALLQAAVKTVVCQARLKPFKINGAFLKSNGIITYKFELP
jgi:TonB family protein